MTDPADHVCRRNISELVPYARNARTHSDDQIAQLADSIKEWGWTVPVLIDENGEVISGHGRILAAKKLNIDDVPTVVCHGWSEAQKRAYRIADNKLALNAGWDTNILSIEFSELSELDFDVELTGFELPEIERLIDGPQAPSEFAKRDEDIRTDYVCPKCGFQWSGGKREG